MENKLCKLVDIIENNKQCVILKVKENKKLDLIKLGCFNGNEEMFRLTKGKDHTCTVFDKNGDSFSWHWGESGYTLVSDQLKMEGTLIEKCITEDFDIYIGANEELINKSLNIKSIDDTNNVKHTIEMMYFKNDNNICVHKDNEFYSFFNTINDAKEHFKNLNYDITYKKESIAPTGCIVEEYKIERRKELEWKEKPYFLQLTDLRNLNDKDSFTVARVINGVNSVELHYNNGKATIEYGTRIRDDYWESTIEEIDWFNKNMSEEVMTNKLWDLYREEYGLDDYGKEI